MQIWKLLNYKSSMKLGLADFNLVLLVRFFNDAFSTLKLTFLRWGNSPTCTTSA